MARRLISIYKDAFSGLSHSVWLLSLIMFINRAGAMVLPFMTLFLTKDLGYSLSQAGWAMGAYGVGSILGAYIGGQLTDKYGFYYIQLYSLLGSAIFLFLLVFIEDYYLILVTIFLFALVADALRPANSVAIATYSKPENRTRSFSLMRFAINLGFATGPAVGGMIAQYAGYHWIFLLNTLTNILAAYILFRYLPYDDSYRPAKREATTPRGLSAYKDITYIKFIILTAIWGMLFFQLFATVPTYWSMDYGFSEGKIGRLLALNGLIIVLIEMPIVKRLEHLTNFMEMIALGSVMLVGGFLALNLGGGLPGMAVLFIVLMSMGELFSMPFMINYAVSRPDEDRRGQYMALYSIAYGVANILAPIGAMQVAEIYGFNTAYWIAFGLSILITILFLSMRKVAMTRP
ncbi:MAG: MFS transporter [Saprospiraceae bacterium]|nr:MFS transporter [Saprospiraceae bacterium]MCZ2338679.1 MFS transporter [Chitinophagales bacterium]